MTRWTWTLAVLMLVVTGCDKEDAGESPAADADGDAERFVLVQRVIAEDDRQQYVHVLDSLPEGQLSTRGALEIPGYAQFNYYRDRLYVSNGDDMTLRRYEITENGDVAELGVLSFTDFGLVGSPVPEFIDDEAWIWNGAQVIVVDLESFEIATPEPLDFAEIFEGIPEPLLASTYATGAAFQAPTRFHHGMLYVTVSATNYDDPLAEDGHVDHARVAIIDVARREVVSVLDDERCSSDADTSPIEADGGFWVTGTAAQTFETVWGDGRHTCMLRFDTTTDRFDEDGLVDIHAVTDGREALEMNWFKDGVFYFPATDTSLYTDDEDRWNAILGSNPAEWMMLNVRTKEAALVTGDGVGPMGPWGNAWLRTGRVFLDVTRGASGVQSDSTTLVEVDPDTHVARELFSYTGDAVGLFKIGR